MAITYHAGRRIQGLSTYSVAKAWEFSNGRATGSFQMLPTGTSAFTLMVWIKPLNFSSSHTVLRSGSVNDSISFYSNTTGIRWTGSVGTVEIADNTTSGWTHIAIARNGSGTDYLYVNGVASSSTASTGSKTIPSISDWHIGDRHENDEEWGGDMSQWLVYTDQKSLSEIQAVYNSGNGTLSPSTTNLQTHYNFAQTGSTLTDQEGTNNCTASGTIVKEKDGFPSKPTNVQVGSRWEETDTRKMYHKVDVTGSDVSLTGLKAYYKFNEASGNIINQAESVGSSDSIGTNADMTITGATYDQTGIIGKALSFDGSNDYGTLGSSLSNFNFLHGTGDWSINFWVKYDEFIAEDRFLSNLDSTELRGMDMAVGWNGDPDGSLGMAIKSDNGFMVNQGGFTFPATVSAGAWVMITMTCDYSDTTNTYKVYLNGSAGGTQARGTTGSTGNSEYSLKLACRGNAVNKFFDGSFDELSIWQRELSQSEITSLYNSGNGKEINSDAWSELGT